MPKSFFKKGLVVGIIVLFIGIGIHPAIALTDKKQNIKADYNENVPYLTRDIIVDQVVDTKCGSFYGRHQIKSHMPIGQSFKPLFKRHYGIELYISDFNPQNPLVPIKISLRNDTINGTFIPGTDVTLNLTSGDGWRYFEFSSPVDLIINQTYVIDISTTNPRWGVSDTDGDCYTRGIGYLEGNTTRIDLYFRTYVLDNNPPDKPSIHGPKSGFVGVEYSFSFNSTDPDRDNITYIIYWGDGYIDEFGPYYQGLEITANHTWSAEGEFLILASVKDIYGLEGPENSWPFPIRTSKEINQIQETTDDCDCQSNGKQHLAEKLLNKLEKNEALSDVIDFNNPDDDRPICKILEMRLNYIVYMFGFFVNMLNRYPEGSYLYDFYFKLCNITINRGIFITFFGFYMGCWDIDPYLN